MVSKALNVVTGAFLSMVKRCAHYLGSTLDRLAEIKNISGRGMFHWVGDNNLVENGINTIITAFDASRVAAARGENASMALGLTSASCRPQQINTAVRSASDCSETSIACIYSVVYATTNSRRVSNPSNAQRASQSERAQPRATAWHSVLKKRPAEFLTDFCAETRAQTSTMLA